MDLRRITVTGLVALGIILVPFSNAIAAKRLGLHVTEEELTIWKQRTANGPYKRAGDVSTNSPGDWDRILSKANAFLSNPSSDRWKGLETDECLKLFGQPGYSQPLPERNRSLGEKLRDAAFLHLITGDTRYRTAVRSELLAQAAEPGTDFTNTKRWCSSITGDGNPTFDITMWLTKLLFGYSYIRESLSTADRTTLDKWFQDAGTFWERPTRVILENRFPRRANDDYTPGWGNMGPRCFITHYGGWTKCEWHEAWNNRGASHVRFYGLVGILMNDTFLKNRAKQYFKEWLKYSVYPDGTDSDFHRWTASLPTLGFGYAGLMIGPMVTLADHFARDGDMELYEYITSDGLFGTAGGLKNLKQVISLYMKHGNHSVLRYGTDDSTRNGNPNYIIDSVYEPLNWYSIGDVWKSPANIFYQDNFIKSIYMRTASGAPPYPSNPATSGFNSWGGEQGIYPGVLFMFGQMEGKVWPYPLSGGDSTPPSPPKGLRIQ